MAAAFGGGPILSYGFIAGEDLSAAQFKFVYLSADLTVKRCTAATDIPIGILQNKPAVAGQAANVVVAGVSRLVTGTGGATLAAAIGVEADSGAPGNVDGGRGIIKTTNKDIGAAVVIQAALEDEIAVVFVNCMNINKMSL